MQGIRLTKDYWPEPKVLAWPDGFARLPGVLAPVAGKLDACWWYIGGQGVTLRPDVPRNPTKEDYARAMPGWERRMADLNEHLTENGAKPGFFSRFGDGLSGDWKFYAAVDSEEEPITYFEQLSKTIPDLLARPKDPPPDVCLIVQGIDYMYWELFFRDEGMFQAVWNHLQNREHLIVESV